MKTVILTAGPQGAGKSTYCKRVITAFPDIKLLSRDELLNELFGDVWLDPYGGGHCFAMKQLWQRIRKSLVQPGEHHTLILDCWNGSERERSSIVKKLRESGADQVIAWFFVTPLEYCIDWFISRECEIGEAEWKRQSWEQSCSHNFHLFHERANDLQEGIGFDRVRRINPLQLQLFPEIFPL